MCVSGFSKQRRTKKTSWDFSITKSTLLDFFVFVLFTSCRLQKWRRLSRLEWARSCWAATRKPSFWPCLYHLPQVQTDHHPRLLNQTFHPERKIEKKKRKKRNYRSCHECCIHLFCEEKMKKELSVGMGLPFLLLDMEELSGSGLLLGSCW